MNKGGHESDKDRFQSVITAARGKSPEGTGLDISLCRDVQPCEGTVKVKGGASGPLYNWKWGFGCVKSI